MSRKIKEFFIIKQILYFLEKSNLQKIQVTNIFKQYRIRINFQNSSKVMDEQELKINGQIKIINSQIEGECYIQEVYALKQQQYKQFLVILLNIITFGGYYLLENWYERSLLKLRYCYTDDIKQATHFLIVQLDNTFQIVKRNDIMIPEEENFEIQLQSAISFDNRFLRYIYSEEEKYFKCIHFNYTNFLEKNQLGRKGLNQQQLQLLEQCYGKCIMQIPIPSYWSYLHKELINPFFMFQIFSVCIWAYDDYYAFCIAITLILSISTASNICQIRSNLASFTKIAFYETEIMIKRDKIEKQTSSNILPGDLFYINDQMKVPCDCILIQGQALVNEASLTGESVPVLKYNYEFNEEVDKKCILYEGTSVIQIQNNTSEHGCLALAIRTGFTTHRGQLVRSILFPRPHSFKFYEESIKFLKFLFALTFVAFAILLPRLYQTMELHYIALKLTDLLTVTVPPSLPFALQVGVVFSMQMLKQKKIYCINSEKVVVGGRVDTVVFDKTGTLTEDRMDLKGFLPIDDNGNFFKNELVKEDILNVFQKENTQHISKSMQISLNCMGSCHSIMIRKNQQCSPKQDALQNNYKNHLIGDPMEIQLLNISGCKLYANGDISSSFGQQFKIIKTLEFSSERQKMTVICEDKSELIQENKFLYVFSKGAPEAIHKICNNYPKNYNKMLDKYTQEGLRVLSLAYKKLPFSLISQFQQNSSQNTDQNNSNVNTNNLQPESIESEMNFLGFVFFENPLKEATAQTLQQLKEAKINIIMATGDNPQTALSVGEKCHFFDFEDNVTFINLAQLGNNKRLTLTNSKFNTYAEVSEVDELDEYLSDELSSFNSTDSQENKDQSEQPFGKDKEQLKLLKSLKQAEELNSQGRPRDLISKNENDERKKLSNKESSQVDDIELKDNILIQQKSSGNKSQTKDILNGEIKQKCKVNEKQDQLYICDKNSTTSSSQKIGDESIDIENDQQLNKQSNSNSSEDLKEEPDSLHLPISQYVLDSFIREALNQKSEGFVMNGAVFDEIYFKGEINDLSLMLLEKTRIFARMKPNHKTYLVELLQKRQKAVAMVGDGANDCGALKQADIGLALSQLEASISAPFSGECISNIIEVLIQCRAGLKTAFNNFNFIAMYSIVQFTTTTILYYCFSMQSDLQLLYIDILVVSSLILTMGMTSASNKLSMQLPDQSLISLKNMLSLGGHTLLNIITQLVILFLLSKQSFFEGIEANKQFYEKEDIMTWNSSEVSTLFLFSNFIYLALSICYSDGKPFKNNFYTNKLFICNFMVLLAYCIQMCLVPSLNYYYFYINTSMSFSWCSFMCIAGIGYILLSYFYENTLLGIIYAALQKKTKKE
ncbi:E1-E2 ATPase family protein (macronuclear) [Tetrahymena thermophila SB210]|uniref:E1-E2 ATPase family protein n=1 Tax=Tetrahymena thermophila (strain SB210) TaxID=312017 RepID=I7MI73_TETTS|nr:E1-E2 ATPase family protein [Tetrahymena thermophila SB210]EAR90948.2 E1-E2 ATPase family protein [Tetrahymena thermophila SB210]|eukprot:XP_001011193.2 E1-E2 ATPase family protein [Tetrahymena thermophila SB210]